MTRFVHIHVDLGHLSPDVTELIPNFAVDTSPVIQRCTGTVFSTIFAAKRGKRLAIAIEAAISVPQALSLTDFQIGTSIFAACCAGLELVRIELAHAGLPKAALNTLKVDHVSLKSAAVTYVLPFAGESSATRFKRLLRQHGLLIGLAIDSSFANHRTRYRLTLGSAAAGTDTENNDLEGLEVWIDQRYTSRFVQIDAVLTEDWLNSHGWGRLTTWRDAYKQARYKHIFESVVREMFQLDGNKREHPQPSKEVLGRLGLRDAKLLEEYIAGNDPKTFSGFPFIPRGREISDQKGWRTSQKVILEQTGIDIKKTWAQYRLHYPNAIEEQLVYPGDHLPEKEAIPTHFCAENWLSLQANLRRVYYEMCRCTAAQN